LAGAQPTSFYSAASKPQRNKKQVIGLWMVAADGRTRSALWKPAADDGEVEKASFRPQTALVRPSQRKKLVSSVHLFAVGDFRKRWATSV